MKSETVKQGLAQRKHQILQIILLASFSAEWLCVQIEKFSKTRDENTKHNQTTPVRIKYDYVYKNMQYAYIQYTIYNIQYIIYI